MTELMQARLVAYEPDGARTATQLVDPVSWDASFVQNDLGALSIQYPTVLDAADLIGRQLEVAVEVHDGTEWVEPRNARFVSSEASSDPSVDLDVPTVTLRSYSSLLERCQIIRPTDFEWKDRTKWDADGKRKFLSASPGQIILTVLQEAREKYTMLPGLSVDFTTTHDSMGQLWNSRTSVSYGVDMTLADVMADLNNFGFIDWWVDGRTLRAVNAESAVVDRNVRLHFTDVEEAPIRSTFENLVTHVRVDGKDGKRWERQVPGATVAHGARVKVIANDSISTKGTADSLIDQEIRRATAPRREYNRSIQAFDVRPLIDYELGDRVYAANYAGTFELMRVFELGLTWDQSSLSARITLNDRFVDADVRQQKKINGITHGASYIGGDGSLPSRSDKAQPAAPTGLTINSQGYWDGAVPKSSVNLGWVPVDTDVDGVALNGVDYYEAVVALPFGGGQTARVEDTSAGFDGLEPSRIYRARARAISSTGIVGAWSAWIEVVTAAPTALLDPPTAPVLVTANGAFEVRWDGKLQGDGDPYDPPLHFSHVVVETARTGDSEWVRHPKDHGFVFSDLTAGDTWYARLVAVDAMGRESEYSALGWVTIQSAVQDALDRADQAAADALEAKGKAQETADDLEAARDDIETALTGGVSIDRLYAEGAMFDTAVIDTLIGQDAFFTRMLTERLIVAGDNLVPFYPGDTTKPITYTPVADTSISQTSNTTYGPRYQFLGGSGVDGQLSDTAILTTGTAMEDRLNAIPARAGEVFAVRALISLAGSTSSSSGNQAAVRIDYWDASGVWISFERSIVTLGWVPVTAELQSTAPAGAAAMTVRLQKDLWANDGLGAGVALYDVRVTRGVGATMIEPGAVTTPHLAAGSVDTDKLKAGALDAFQITAPLIQSVSAASRGIKWTGDTIIAYNSSGAERFRLDGTRATITAGTFHTDPATNRGVTMDSSGLRAWDSAGNQLINITSSSGLIQGATIRTSHGTSASRIEMRPNSSSSPGLFLTTSGGKDLFEMAVDPSGTFSSGTRMILRSPQSNNNAHVQIAAGPAAGQNSASVIVGDSTIQGARASLSFTLGQPSVRVISGGNTAYLSVGGLYLPSGGTFTSTQVVSSIGTSTQSANVWHSSSTGIFYRSTSLRKFKEHIEPLSCDPYAILDVEPVTWHDSQEWADYEQDIESQGHIKDGVMVYAKDWTPRRKPLRITGFIAEDMAAVLPGLCVYDEDGELQGVAYDRVPAALVLAFRAFLAEFRGAEDRISALEQQLTA